MFDNTIFYKQVFNTPEFLSKEQWDVYISSYINTDRAKIPFQAANAKSKYWIVNLQYGFRPEDYPTVNANEYLYVSDKIEESEFIKDFFEQQKLDLSDKKICIDITSFVRPTLIFLLWYLKNKGIKQFDAIYTEPSHYVRHEETSFSDDNVIAVRPVRGCEGSHKIESDKKALLIIGTGYDNSLVAHVAENKEQSEKVGIFGFPSLMADMYQENIIRVQRAYDSLEPAINSINKFFAPANDPFVTANTLNDILEKKGRERNLYLCPLGTKAQVLGFILFYLQNCHTTDMSIIYPFCSKYESVTTKGIARIWKYEVKLIDV